MRKLGGKPARAAFVSVSVVDGIGVPVEGVVPSIEPSSGSGPHYSDDFGGAVDDASVELRVGRTPKAVGPPTLGGIAHEIVRAPSHRHRRPQPAVSGFGDDLHELAPAGSTSYAFRARPEPLLLLGVPSLDVVLLTALGIYAIGVFAMMRVPAGAVASG
jgi:hypothetical protein